MSDNLIAETTTLVNAPAGRVWNALISPELIHQYMFGTQVVSDWRVTSPIVWKGQWQGKAYEDKGVILELKPERILSFSHFSPLAGLPDSPENYHIVTIQLSPEGNQTRVTLTQDHNSSEEERAHSAKNWEMVLAGLKKTVELTQTGEKGQES